MLSFVIITSLANARFAALIWIVGPLCVLGFTLLVRRYNKVDHLKRQTIFLKEINEAEVLKFDSKLSDFPAGQSFLIPDHPYVSDLDIFGRHSLFQLLNRTTTESGQARLAEWLSAPANKEVIYERQQAIKELSPKLEWRQNFQAAGLHFKHTNNDYGKLLTWIAKPIKLLPRQSIYLFVSVPLSVLATWAAVYFFFHIPKFKFAEEVVPYVIPLIIIQLVNILILRSVKSIAEEITEDVLNNIKMLGGYQSLITKIESEQFHSAMLLKIQSDLRHTEYSAAAEIRKLIRILEIFQLRGRKRELNHQFYSLFNNLWLFDVYLIILTEKWKYKNGSYLKVWASAVSEFEVLSSLAGFHYSNPSYAFPEIKDDPYTIQFEMLGHPLINAKSRVCNSFHLNGRGEIAMITGSNMAGKSTFLRTVGLNLVLAFIGAPCCAKSGKVSSMKIFSSMRTQDNLEEGVSSFYAELKRIEQLLKLIHSGEAIFFLLDEMFKGTNSQDRYKGGVSLIKQLSELNAFGIISTHDLELAKLAGNHMIVANFSFNSKIKDGELIFNYRLTDGICSDFNASELMKRSGIKILSDIEKI